VKAEGQSSRERKNVAKNALPVALVEFAFPQYCIMKLMNLSARAEKA
jgi:hypothetical protein